jgi:hypothetical protein
MSLADLRRRLERHEAGRHVEQPTKIVANCPVEDAKGRDANRNWWQWVQDGPAPVAGDVRYLMQPSLTAEEWTAAHVSEH